MNETLDNYSFYRQRSLDEIGVLLVGWDLLINRHYNDSNRGELEEAALEELNSRFKLAGEPVFAIGEGVAFSEDEDLENQKNEYFYGFEGLHYGFVTLDCLDENRVRLMHIITSHQGDGEEDLENDADVDVYLEYSKSALIFTEDINDGMRISPLEPMDDPLVIKRFNERLLDIVTSPAFNRKSPEAQKRRIGSYLLALEHRLNFRGQYLTGQCSRGYVSYHLNGRSLIEPVTLPSEEFDAVCLGITTLNELASDGSHLGVPEQTDVCLVLDVEQSLKEKLGLGPEQAVFVNAHELLTGAK